VIAAAGRTIRPEVLEITNSSWNKEEMPEEWKESIILHIFKTGGKTDSSNHRGTSLLPNKYKTLSNILLSRLTPYAEEIIGDHQSEFRRNRLTSDYMF